VAAAVGQWLVGWAVFAFKMSPIDMILLKMANFQNFNLPKSQLAKNIN
jgi:hypothetical protein